MAPPALPRRTPPRRRPRRRLPHGRQYTRPLERDQAVRALADGIEACTHCRPDTELGLLDG
ncbi:DUF6233 domain-containing protein [Streptomyces sp. NPDC048825]|uniref:DUF6233 domain-containing protein n=1 Tax=Streptomyces sp. NPDC048825 TaxID=3365592 RepID=UPI00371F9CEA